MAFLANTLDLFLEAAPWLLVGLLFAGLIKAWVPQTALTRWLGGHGVWPVTKAALIGAPLPLCSCGVLPAALGLRRAGASKGATVSFLVATPETGPDSIFLSYALLGPLMAVARPIAAVASAIAAGLLAAGGREQDPPPPEQDNACCGGSCSPAQTLQAHEPARGGVLRRAVGGLRFAAVDIFDDIAGWLIIGFVVAGAAVTFVPPQALGDYGSGLPAMLVMLAAGIPIYVCASASTPIAAAMIAAGVSPGTALVFLLAGPATNLAAIAIVGRDLGRRALAGYLAGVAGGALASGLAVDALLVAWGIDVAAQVAETRSLIPHWLEALSGAVLALLALAWAVRRYGPPRAVL